MWVFWEKHGPKSKKYHCFINKDIANESLELGNKPLLPKAEPKFIGMIKDKDLNFQNLQGWLWKHLIKTDQ